MMRFKQKYSKPKRMPKTNNILEGRTYKDFTKYSPNSAFEVVEMDTVIGRQGGKALLTMQFCTSHFMLAFLLKDKTSVSVTTTFYHIRDLLEKHNLSQSSLMPVILTDNGSEFANPLAIEVNHNTGEYESKVFFCTPYRSCEKPHVENNHTLIRRILPNSCSFDDLTQSDINLILSHVNSYKRKSLMDKAPIELFESLHPGIAYLFGINTIPQNDIILRPTLIK